MNKHKTTIAALSLVGLVLLIGGTATAWLQATAVAGDPNEKTLIEQRYQKDKLVTPAVITDPAKERPNVPVTNPPAPTGIIELTVAPFPASQFLATNRWQGILGGQLIAVIAGGQPNTSGGQLMVLTLDKDGLNTLDTRRIELPGQPGRARVISASGTTVTVQTDGGKRFTFDAATRVLTALP